MTNYFLTARDDAPMIAIEKQLVKMYSYYNSTNKHKIAKCIDRMIDIIEIDSIIQNLCGIQSDFNDETLALEYIATNGGSINLKACQIYANVPVKQFGSVKLASKLYGKSIKYYLNDVSALINLNRFGSITNQIYKSAVIKIVERLVLLTVSLAIYYLYIVSLFEFYDVQECNTVVYKIVDWIKHGQNSLADLVTTEQYLTNNFLHMYNDNSVLLQRFEKIHQLYINGVVKYYPMTDSMFSKYLKASPDFKILLPSATSDIIRSRLKTEHSKSLLILLYLLLPGDDKIKCPKTDAKQILKPTVEKLSNCQLTIEL